MNRRVNMVQKARLIKIMEEHVDVLFGKAPGDRQKRNDMWADVAKDLNGRGLGVAKSAKEWRHTFSNMRLSVHDKLRNIRAHTKRSRGVPLPPNMGLSDFDQRIVRICMPSWRIAWKENQGYKVLTMTTSDAVAHTGAASESGQRIDQAPPSVQHVAEQPTGQPTLNKSMPRRSAQTGPKSSTSYGLTSHSIMSDDDDLIEEVKIEQCSDPLALIIDERELHSPPVSTTVMDSVAQIPLRTAVLEKTTERNVQVQTKPKSSTITTSLTIPNTLMDDELIGLVKVEPYSDAGSINVEEPRRTATTGTNGIDSEIPHRPLSGSLQQKPVASRLDEMQGRLLHTLENNALIRERNELLRQQNELLQTMNKNTESYRSEVLAHYKEMREMKRRKLAFTLGEDGKV